MDFGCLNFSPKGDDIRMIRSIQPIEYSAIWSDDETAADNTTVVEPETVVPMDTPEEVACVRQIQEHVPSLGLYHAIFFFFFR